MIDNASGNGFRTCEGFAGRMECVRGEDTHRDRGQGSASRGGSAWTMGVRTFVACYVLVHTEHVLRRACALTNYKGHEPHVRVRVSR